MLESQVTFAMNSIHDRQLFTSASLANRTAGPCSRENSLAADGIHQSSPFSTVRLVEQKLPTMGIIREFSGRTKAEILCSPDCVAEREGFEPSVQVLARTTV